MPTTPRFIYFDLGNVLFHFDQTRICKQIAEVADLPIGDVTSFFAADHMLELETGTTTMEAVYDLFCQTFQVSPRIDDLAYAGSDIFQINAEMIPLVTRLAQSNHRMGILSNTNAPHWEFLASGRYRIVPGFFEVTALSYQIQSMKPDSRIYQVATEMVGIPPGEIFFTDDREENVEGARAVGWQAVLFKDAFSLEQELRQRGVEFN